MMRSKSALPARVADLCALGLDSIAQADTIQVLILGRVGAELAPVNVDVRGKRALPAHVAELRDSATILRILVRLIDLREPRAQLRCLFFIGTAKHRVLVLRRDGDALRFGVLHFALLA